MEIQLSDEERIKVLNSDDLYPIMQQILLREQKIDQNREHLWVVGLEANNRLLLIELISMGTVNQTLAVPMEVFSLSLQKRAVSIILVHNHPSGELKASDEDEDVTDRMIQVGLIVKTPVLDHLIITDKSYLSFKEEGLMEKLSYSLKYVPPYMQLTRIEENGEKQGAKAAFVKVAKQLMEKGIPIETIQEITGLTKSEMKRLL